MGERYDCIIIGAGAAGLTAGIYAARANMRTVLIEKLVPGGQAALTAFVENYPGFPDGVAGFDLMDLMRRHALAFGLEVVSGEVTTIEPDEGGFRLVTAAGDLRASTIVISTGVRPRMLGVPGESTFFGRGVSTCATCDGALYRGREVAVIGGGDSAFDEGLFLTRFASKVHIVHRRDAFRAIPSLVKKAAGNEKVVMHLNSVVTAINGDDAVTSITLADTLTAAQSTLDVEGVFLYVGLVPNTDMFRGMLDLDAGGFITVDRDLATSVPGIFAAGDVRDTPFRQIITAASDGALAAHSAGKYLENVG